MLNLFRRHLGRCPHRRKGRKHRACTCPLDRHRLLLYTQKTGVPVDLPLPPQVVKALRELPRRTPDYFFWTGESTAHSVTGKWRTRRARVFRLAGIEGGHPHRFRDTFAVEVLLNGVPIDQAMVLLGHSSVRIAEQHYAPWVEARQERRGPRGAPCLHGAARARPTRAERPRTRNTVAVAGTVAPGDPARTIAARIRSCRTVARQSRSGRLAHAFVTPVSTSAEARFPVAPTGAGRHTDR